MERSIKEQVGAATWESWPVGARMAIADAQATIAALQARVQELCKFRQADHEQLVEVQKYWRESQDEVHELQSQLTQRTAELEAAKREVDVWKEKAELRGKEACAQRAELERVSAERDELKGQRDTMQEHINLAVPKLQEADTLRTIILALPKMEGEIRVGKTVDDCWFIDNQDAGGLRGTYKDDGPKYAALLQHRQGMEAKHEE